MVNFSPIKFHGTQEEAEELWSDENVYKLIIFFGIQLDTKLMVSLIAIHVIL